MYNNLPKLPGHLRADAGIGFRIGLAILIVLLLKGVADAQSFISNDIEVQNAANRARIDLSTRFIGRVLPDLHPRCVIEVVNNTESGSGITTFANGTTTMTVRGTRHEILNNVLPHEVMHTVINTIYNRPMPRWFDEGIASVVGSSVTPVGFTIIPFQTMFDMMDYPADPTPLYLQSVSVVRFLILHGDERLLIKFGADSLRLGWPESLKSNYNYNSLTDFQSAWLNWTRKGSPTLGHVALQPRCWTESGWTTPVVPIRQGPPGPMGPPGQSITGPQGPQGPPGRDNESATELLAIRELIASLEARVKKLESQPLAPVPMPCAGCTPDAKSVIQDLGLLNEIINRKN